MKTQDIGLANSNILSEFSREPRELPWQPNLNKNRPKLHRFQSCARNRGIFRMKSQDFGSATTNMLSQFSRKPRELLWQPNSEKYKPKLHKFLFLAKIEEFFACSVGFMDFSNSNMLPEFSRELRELPWQPNLGKHKPKLHNLQFLARNLEILSK